jgi:signal transduction histidine kinase
MSDSQTQARASSRRLATVFKLALIFGTVLFLIRGATLAPIDIHDLPELLFWVAITASVSLMPVPAWGGLRFGVDLPVILAVAILYPPITAGWILFVGLFDEREIRRQMPIMNSLLNRSIFAVMAMVSSLVFHQLASIHSAHSQPVKYILGGLIAAAAGYAANVFLVSLVMTLESSMSLGGVVSQLRMGALKEFLLNYVALGVVGLAIAVFYHDVSWWAVVAFMAPLIFARQMFFRMMSLEEAGKELRARQRVLRALSNRMAEERQDERTQIAAYLHDDLAQSLFQLTLRLEMAKKRLHQGDMDAVEKDLEDISSIKERTSNMVRSLVRDLHRSPIGREGLGEALQSFADEASRDTQVAIAVDVVDVTLPPPIQLLIYQIGREAVMNSMKHAKPHNILISVHETETGVELQVRDDGTGFDTNQGQPEGHFGTVMMRERALVAGGTFSIESEVGKGTTVTARFPRVWIEEHLDADLEALAKEDSESHDAVTPPSDRGRRPPADAPRQERDPAAAPPTREPEPAGRPAAKAPVQARPKQDPLSA